jgi:hypothetical protein
MSSYFKNVRYISYFVIYNTNPIKLFRKKNIIFFVTVQLTSLK